MKKSKIISIISAFFVAFGFLGAKTVFSAPRSLEEFQIQKQNHLIAKNAFLRNRINVIESWLYYYRGIPPYPSDYDLKNYIVKIYTYMAAEDEKFINSSGYPMLWMPAYGEIYRIKTKDGLLIFLENLKIKYEKILSRTHQTDQTFPAIDVLDMKHLILGCVPKESRKDYFYFNWRSLIFEKYIEIAEDMPFEENSHTKSKKFFSDFISELNGFTYAERKLLFTAQKRKDIISILRNIRWVYKNESIKFSGNTLQTEPKFTAIDALDTKPLILGCVPKESRKDYSYFKSRILIFEKYIKIAEDMPFEENSQEKSKKFFSDFISELNGFTNAEIKLLSTAHKRKDIISTLRQIRWVYKNESIKLSGSV